MNFNTYLTSKSVAAISLCFACAAMGCIAETAEDIDDMPEDYIDQAEAIENGKVFDVAPGLVATGAEKAAPDTEENLNLRKRYKAVGILTSQPMPKEWWGLGDCTATLVGPRTVLTAAHCVTHPGPLYFQLDERETIKAKQVIKQPWVSGAAKDIAVVILEKNVTGIIPKPINFVEPQKGQNFKMVGYGGYDYTKPDGTIGYKGNGTKRITTNTISGLSAYVIEYSKSTGGSSVKGDSGGPLFLNGPTGGEFVAGVVAGANANTGATSNVHGYVDWIYDSSKGDVRFYNPLSSEVSSKRTIRAKGSSKCLTHGQAQKILTLTNCNGSSAQKWDLRPRANGTYGITQDGECWAGGEADACIMGAPSGNQSDVVRMRQCLSSNVPSSCERYEVKSQDWILSQTSTNTFSIHSLNGLECVALKNNQVVLDECANVQAQKWEISP